MNRVVITGKGGEVRWGYRKVATLDTWTVSAEPAGATLTASVVSSDSFAASQRPLTFVVPRQKGQWIWPVTSLQIADGRLSASLDPQE